MFLLIFHIFHNHCFLETQYSEWIPVPEDKSTYVYELVEGKKFQMQTDKKITNGNDIRWTGAGGVGWITFDTTAIGVSKCNGGYKLKGTEGFLKRAGVLTFLKTTTQLEIWFDDVLEVTWVYEDNSDGGMCAMRNKLTGLRFHGSSSSNKDKVSTHYRYELGNLSQISATIARDDLRISILKPYSR